MCTQRRRGVDVRSDNYTETCHLLSSGDCNLESGVLVAEYTHGTESGVLVAEYTHGVVTQKVETAAQRLTLLMLTVYLVLLWG